MSSSQQPSLPPLGPLGDTDREAVLRLLTRHLSEAWASFDRPRPAEPQLSETLRRQPRGAAARRAG